MEYYLPHLLLAVILAVCLYTDLKERKIYNKVILAGIIAGLIVNIIFSGLTGILFSLAGFLLGIGLLFLPFAAGGIGAGDVKLMGVVGIFNGAGFVFSAFILSALAGGIFALAALLMQKRLLSTLGSMGRSIKLFIWSGFKVNSLPSKNTASDSINIPYAPAIVIGVIAAFILENQGITLIQW